MVINEKGIIKSIVEVVKSVFGLEPVSDYRMMYILLFQVFQK